MKITSDKSLNESETRNVHFSFTPLHHPLPSLTVAVTATDAYVIVPYHRYSDQIQHLSEEFRRKRKKGKLPVNATDVLRGWWEKNLAWPYPSEDEKRALAGQTDLSATQINNWFINQRKRHWHKV